MNLLPYKPEILNASETGNPIEALRGEKRKCKHLFIYCFPPVYSQVSSTYPHFSPFPTTFSTLPTCVTFSDHL